jgi:hypothetical protein
MSRAGRSFFCFGFWVVACGLALMFAPGMALKAAGITSSSDIFIRVFGTVLLYMGIFYLVAGKASRYTALYRASVYTRASAPIAVGAFVLLTGATPLPLALTALDAAGALWTALALRADRRSA